jgi:uncharacterized protein YbjT (DUF2867 family)
MKLAVFGSTGGNGRLILAEAVRRGHEVTAFARRPEALSAVTGLAAVVGGDARDPADAAKAVAGQDAVIMTVSARGEPGAATTIARTVATAMAAQGVSRLVATSAYGMVATRPYVLAAVVRMAFRRVFADQAAADQVIEDSGLDWTILRATRLTTGRVGRPPRVSAQLFTRGPYSLARDGYAAALVDLAENGAHVRHVINITGGTRD